MYQPLFLYIAEGWISIHLCPSNQRKSKMIIPLLLTDTNNKLVCLFSNQDNISGIFRDNRFEIYVDNNEQIMGFSICDLSENEKKLVDNLPIINQ